jgi:HMG (high mobility group) box
VLAEYPYFVKQLDKHKGDDDVVKDLHQLMYGIPGKKLETKKNIRQFSGFPAGVNKDEKISKMTENKKKWTVGILKTCMELFGLEKSGTREELIVKLIDYLMKPKEIKGEDSAKSKSSRRSSTGSTAGKKRKKGKKSKKSGEKKPKRAPSGFLLYSNSVRAEVKEANPELSFTDIAKAIGAKWKELSEEERKKWVDTAAEKGGKADGADEAAGDEDEDEEEEEEDQEDEEEEEAETDDDDDDLFSPDDDGYGGKTKSSARDDSKPEAADEADTLAASGTAVAGDVEAEAEAEAEL